MTSEEIELLREILSELREINQKLDTISNDVANILMK
jgi:flagellar basal body rod protein FlgG